MILPKIKKCSGNGVAKGHGCGQPAKIRKYGLGMSCCYAKWLYGSEEGQKKLYSSLKAGSRIVKSKQKAEDRTKREKLKTLSQYEAEAKKAFQKFIRLRDKSKPCISCGNPNPSDWCGSHYFPAGVYSGLIFDERNCHGACNTYCNKYLSGNLANYRIGLVNRYGKEFVEGLENDSALMRDYRYTKEQLIEIKKKYELKSKEING